MSTPYGPGPTNAFTSGTWAARPAATGRNYYFATDLGNHGVLLHSDGTNWTPVSSSCVLYQSGVATSTTNSATETNLLVVPIPAGLLTTKGRIDFEGAIVATGTTNTKSVIIRISTISGDTSGGYTTTGWTLAAANLGGAFSRHLWANNSTSAQITEQVALLGPGVSNGSGAASAIDTTAAWYVNFNGKTTNAADTIGYAGITVRWTE